MTSLFKDKRLLALYLPVLTIFLPDILFVPSCFISLGLILSDTSLIKEMFNLKLIKVAFGFIIFTSLVALFKQNYFGLLASILYSTIVLYLGLLSIKLNHNILNKIYFILGVGSLINPLFTIFNFHNPLTNIIVKVFSFLLDETYENSFETKKRIASTFMNANYYGFILTLMVLLALFLAYKYFFTKHKNYKLGVFYTIVFIVNLCLLPLPESRSVYLALVVGIASLLFFINYKVSLLVVSPILALMLLNIQKVISLMPRAATLLGGASIRIGIWGTGIQIFKSQPLIGSGFYSFLYNYSKFSPTHDIHSHNLFLEMLVSFGIIGTTWLYYIGYLILKNPVTNWIYHNSLNSCLILSMFILVGVHGLTDAAILSPHCLLLFILCISAYSLEGAKDEI